MPLSLNGSTRIVVPKPDYIVLIDKAEKKDVPWPTSIEWRVNAWDAPVYLRIGYESAVLNAGDFAIKNHMRAVGVERKGSLNELVHNLFTDDYARFIRAIERLVATVECPILFLDFPIAEMHTPEATRSKSYVTRNGYRATTVPGLGTMTLSKLAAVVAAYGLRVVGPLPSTTRAKTKAHVRDRRWAADFILRLMLSHVMKPIARTGLHNSAASVPNVLLPSILRRRNARGASNADGAVIRQRVKIRKSRSVQYKS